MENHFQWHIVDVRVSDGKVNQEFFTACSYTLEGVKKGWKSIPGLWETYHFPIAGTMNINWEKETPWKS